ncbi:N-acetylglutamate synthase-like GNAT family acetyltransferase [Anaerosolibacter carboniphilus]|uniref:N-acetylglutamate synthase-like GNAT family acetyltransferase n=1 Tax=Anaerosolibacter carboniphilus TaxID=1417629 RepID=A0A841KV89_9FIRM|nr:GNAT family N-acetyltransferase [Anaerosolibacter carboniphilus]MBB6217341.1 N-acetylglutamate synthase-like GNAT family acetyltransferase [Anaerosolibacter carboniphilus]
MFIRKINEGDLEEVAHIIQRNFDEVMIQKHAREIVEKFRDRNKIEDLRQQMTWKDIYVVEIEGEIVATGALANFGDTATPKYSVSNFHVKPEHHKNGIGKALFNYLFHEAKNMNIDFLHVPSSRTGYDFYEKMGFIKDEAQRDEADEIIWMTMKIRA